MSIAAPSSTIEHRLLLPLWTALLTGHAFAAAAWWWMMPGGFPIGSPHFWVNQILPFLVFALCLTARVCLARKIAIAAFSLSIIGGAWISAGVAARFVFPVTFRALWFAPVLAGCAMLILWMAQFKRLWRGRSAIGWLAGGLLGCLLPASQRGNNPATLPAGNADWVEVPSTLAHAGTVRLTDLTSFDPNSGVVQLDLNRRMLAIEPLLTFDSLSPDRCWTLFARREDRIPPRRQLVQLQNTDERTTALYRDLGQSSLSVGTENDVVQIDAASRLDRNIYSHLNTYATLLLAGHRKPFVSFGPTGNQKFEVTHNTYPHGKPLRFAYVDSDRAFKVVEARSAEKGPFTTLASGTLVADQPLTLTLWDGEEMLASIELLDFSAQASTQLSPTAGWRVPENAIEFSRGSDDPRSAVNIFITLASTSVGRGYDSVGHSAGVYRNRMTVRVR